MRDDPDIARSNRQGHHLVLAFLGALDLLAAPLLLAGVLLSPVRPLPMDGFGEALTYIALALTPPALAVPHLLARRGRLGIAYSLAAAPILLAAIGLVATAWLNPVICRTATPDPGSAWAWCTSVQQQHSR